MRRSLFILSLVFAATLAIVFGVRASSDAIAVIIGVILGVFASVPTTVILTYFLLRSRRESSGYAPATNHTPPIVVINPGDKPAVAPPLSLPPLSMPASQGRQWTLIGDDTIE